MNYTSEVGGSQQAYRPADVAASSATSAPAKVERSTAGASSAATAATSASDQAQVSTAGGLISQALGGSDVRTDKVAALQQQIASGTYNVSASDVADKVIGSLLR